MGMHDNSPPPHCGGGSGAVGVTAGFAAAFSASLARRSFNFNENIATERARFIKLCLTLVFFAASSSAALAAAVAAASSSWLDIVLLLSLRFTFTTGGGGGSMRGFAFVPEAPDAELRGSGGQTGLLLNKSESELDAS